MCYVIYVHRDINLKTGEHMLKIKVLKEHKIEIGDEGFSIEFNVGDTVILQQIMDKEDGLFLVLTLNNVEVQNLVIAIEDIAIMLNLA